MEPPPTIVLRHAIAAHLCKLGLSPRWVTNHIGFFLFDVFHICFGIPTIEMIYIYIYQTRPPQEKPQKIQWPLATDKLYV